MSCELQMVMVTMLMLCQPPDIRAFVFLWSQFFHMVPFSFYKME
jgi:hypothetical protein